ncbi:hypothetical protein BpHYR1_024184 [Brachionus plicatilis]|uniref:Secreted protein n=1 Tax=Brachionus plicatilis TaxID=10195 RepID=A0A3M7SLG3_BRAPC|nr:hypothetical protein BpHYR1_024184 [Brachionus plicatilis]
MQPAKRTMFGIVLLLLVHEVELWGGALQHAVPLEVGKAALVGDAFLDAFGERDRVLVSSLAHFGQVVDVDDDGPAGHHQHQVLEHGVLGAVPEGVAEPRVVLDGHRVDLGVDLKAALFEHHHTGVVDAGALGEYEYGHVGLVVHVFGHALGDQVPVLGFGPVEPDVAGGARERALHHAREARVLLSDH